MCGDHSFRITNTLPVAGSPPHVRGPQLDLQNYANFQGITPACAGTTAHLKGLKNPSWDHPRMCGDHLYSAVLMVNLAGSPPHVRGPLLNKLRKGDTLGITPACAGTTTIGLLYPQISWDHPRMCGDHSTRHNRHIARWGSPPHVRGPRNHFQLSIHRWGITPACAGTTSFHLKTKVPFGDHPRMCGDHAVDGFKEPEGWGSPPHVRGPL